MTHPVGSLLFDTYDNTYLIVVDDNYDEQGEEGAFVNYATHMSGGRWDDRAVRFRQARPLLKWDGSWVVSDTMLNPEEFLLCQRIA